MAATFRWGVRFLIGSVTVLTLLVMTPSNVSRGPVHLTSLLQNMTSVIQKNPNVGIVYLDVLSGESVQFNEKHAFNPASVIKIPIMVEVFKQVLDGRVQFSDRITLQDHHRVWGSGRVRFYRSGTRFSIRSLTDLMIRYSDNTATKMLIQYLGMDNINQTIQSFGLIGTQIQSDNLLEANGLNWTTPSDMATLLHKIVKAEILSPSACSEMIGLLSRQRHRWGIPRYLPKGLRIANKTGSLWGIRNDCGVVFFEDRPYILSIFATSRQSNDHAVQVVSRLSKMVYTWKIKWGGNPENV